MILRAILLADRGGAEIRSVESAAAIADTGLEGDRYADGTGSFSRWPKPGRDVSIVAWEDLEALAAEGFDLRDGGHRRNLVVEGGRLADLVGVRFRIGDAVFQGVRPCLPCGYIEKKAAMPGLKAAMARVSPGLRADVERGGVFRVGQPVEPLD